MTRFIPILSLAALSTGCDWYYDDFDDTADSGLYDTADPVVADCEPIGSDNSWADPGTVTGRVVSPSGSVPVLSAMVEVDVDGESAWMVTSCDGAFSLTLPAGHHTITVAKGRYTAERTVDLSADEQLDLGRIALEVPDVRIAVIDGQYDDVGALLTDAGLPFERYARPSDVFDSQIMLDRFDVVFVNCGTLASTTTYDNYTAAQFTRVRNWVEAGGTLYTSDWEWELFEGVAPEALEFAPDPKEGTVGRVEARLLDRELITMLGKETAELRFELSGWAVARSAEYAFPLVEGELPGGSTPRPLASLYPLGSGKAVFTSFHNESQLTDDMETLLVEMILSL